MKIRNLLPDLILGLILILLFLTMLLLATDLTKRIDTLNGRQNQFDIDMATMQAKLKANSKNAKMVIEEVKRIVSTGFNRLIPIDGGFLAIKEE